MVVDVVDTELIVSVTSVADEAVVDMKSVVDTALEPEIVTEPEDELERPEELRLVELAPDGVSLRLDTVDALGIGVLKVENRV